MSSSRRFRKGYAANAFEAVGGAVVSGLEWVTGYAHIKAVDHKKEQHNLWGSGLNTPGRGDYYGPGSVITIASMFTSFVPAIIVEHAAGGPGFLVYFASFVATPLLVGHTYGLYKRACLSRAEGEMEESERERNGSPRIEHTPEATIGVITDARGNKTTIELS